ncbi:MAG: hypothetical protein PHG04_02580, partial [Candidatus Nanoarchaeia archaeon]|nr:hypothetical protein [Candidatus Nanoarchaeia archaeon]
MKLKLMLLIAAFFAFFLAFSSSISSVSIVPELDVSRFASYMVNATNSSLISSAVLEISGINGDGSDCWDYYVNGSCASETLYFDMIYDSEKGYWKYETIYPDYIYPEIMFAGSEITWNNEPLDDNVWRRNYHLLNFTNPFSMQNNMSFWIEFNAVPNNLLNSNDLFIYIVGKDQGIDYFESDWRNKPSTELVATFSRNDDFDHTHSLNSSHMLVPLSTNPDGTIGNKSIDVSDNFWIIIYQDSTNINRGWNLRYHPLSLCTISNAWYTADRSGGNTWNAPIIQDGCPDAHIHIARREVIIDGVNATIIPDSGDSFSQEFYYSPLPNLAPNPTSFINPVVGGVYNETHINITWNPATDPNNDLLTYNVSLLNSDETYNKTLNVTQETFYYWNITEIVDGKYSLMLEVCDTEPLCINSTLNGNFTIEKTEQIYSLTNISIFSNNSFNSSFAANEDTVILLFNSTGPLINPQAIFHSGGQEISNAVAILNDSNHYNATFKANASDTNGFISFELFADNLDLIYYDSTDESSVFVDTTPPQILIISPENDTYFNGTIFVNISATDSNLLSTWFFNGTQNITYGGADYFVFPEGNNFIISYANDSAGNFNSSRIDFTIETIIEQYEQETPSSSLILQPLTYYADENFSKTGNTYGLRTIDSVVFEINKTNHTLKVNEFDFEWVKISIFSEELTATLEKGETYEFDVNNDGLNDVNVSYLGINNSRIMIFIQQLLSEASSEQEPPEIIEEP